MEQVRRGEVRASRETFADFWTSVREAKRPYVTSGTLRDYATQGRKRLLPWLLAAIDEDRVRACPPTSPSWSPPVSSTPRR